MRRPLTALLAAAAVMLFADSRALAEIHALIVGIDDYAHEQKLAGAVADANDIASVLQRLGVRPLVLRNAEVNRAGLERAWREVVARAKPGDTIIFTYAGHGGQEPWKNAAGQAETAESFLLQRFRAPRPAVDSAERVLGKQLKGWFKEAAKAKGNRLRIIFVADSCHAGGMMRSLDSRAGPTYRSGEAYEIPDVPIVIRPEDEAAPTDLEHVTFIAATQTDRRIPEIVIDGRKRGALSYAFARALEGHADRTRRGQLTNHDLQSYLTSTVRQLSEAQQTPEIIYRTGGANDVAVDRVAKVPERDLGVEQMKLKLRLDNADGAQRAALASNLVGVDIVASGTADLIWDARDLTVLSGVGDMVGEKIGAFSLQGVVDKWRTLAELKALIARKPLALQLSPNDGRHRPGTRLAFSTLPLPFGYVTAFNIASDGTVQFLFPQQRFKDSADGARIPGSSYRLELDASSPFGADHLVIVSSARPLPALHERLQKLPRVIELPQYLRDALGNSDHAIGMQPLYTTDKGSKQ